jgi:hypothetical protein
MSARTIARHLFLNTDRIDLRQTVSTAEVLGMGVAATPFTMTTTGDLNAFSFYLTCPATSGTTRGLYLRLYLTAGAGGEAARIFTTVSDDTPADTVNGAHISLSFGATTGNVTGLGTAVRATLHVPSRSLTGTCAAIQAEIYGDGDGGLVGGTLSFARFCLDGDSTFAAAFMDNGYAMHFAGLTAGAAHMFRTGLTANNSLALMTAAMKINIDGVAYYIPLLTNTNS